MYPFNLSYAELFQACRNVCAAIKTYCSCYNLFVDHGSQVDTQLNVHNWKQKKLQVWSFECVEDTANDTSKNID